MHSEKSRKFTKVLKSTDNEFKYKMAEEYFASKKYSYALQLYEDLIAYIKGTDKYEDMYYKSATCYYFLNDFLNAENYYKSFIETFPNSKRTEDAEFLRAYCFYKQSPKVELDQTPTTKAMALMQAFINTHPNSIRVAEATNVLDICRAKLEKKEYKAAELYYNLGYYRAAAIAFGNVVENFPDSKLADEYKFNTIKSYVKYAELSYEEKQEERYNKVLAECTDFLEQFIDSKYIAEVLKIKNQTNNLIINIKKNEQVKKTN